ncbi:MAG: hypothetical protein M3377_10040, partial [Actinomycetota bacterium]|nr:hypothetical protein [Actinomycetota bacterium]
KKGRAGVSRRWWTVAILAAGIAIGTTLTATPVYSHVGGTVTHLWIKHIRPKADTRYARKLYASVTHDGVLHGKGNALRATRTGVGQYLITFPRNTNGCAGVGNVGLGTANSFILLSVNQVSVDTARNDAVDKRVVRVELRDSNLDMQDSSFHVVVIC